MALDKSKDYGTSWGFGPTRGFAVQNGKLYNDDGDEVDELGHLVKPSPKKPAPPAAAKVSEPAEMPEDVKAQLAAA
jgi:hypothetical protein